MFEYAATVIKVIDGDTVDVEVDLGMHTFTKTRLRILGINAPEVSTASGRLAQGWARMILPIGAFVTIKTQKDKTEKYGRWLADIRLPDGQDYATMAISTGNAVPWDGTGQRPD
jgi:micrococcal nuclease